MTAPRFFSEEGEPHCQAGGRVYRIIEAAGQRWFVPAAAWDSPFPARALRAISRDCGYL